MNKAPKKSESCRLTTIAVAAALSAGTVSAEITIDGSLGPSGSLPGPDYRITPNMGTSIGDNIFHSFGIFNIDTGERALFIGPDGTENIIGRITGGNPSFIDGLIKSDIPGADIWLINPAGMVFGENANLDVNGGFHASTADYLLLGDDGVYHASDPSQSVFSSAMPSAFGFLGANPAPINVEGAQLQAGTAEILSLVGGDLNINNGATIGGVAGIVNLVSLGGPGEVLFDAEFPGLVDSVNSDSPLGSINIQGGSVIDVSEYQSGLGAGAVLIRGGDLTMDNSGIVSNAITRAGGVILIDVEGTATLSGGAGIVSAALGEGEGGVIVIRAKDVRLLDGAKVIASTLGAGEGGYILFDAKDSLTIAGNGTSVESSAYGSGDAGAIFLYGKQIVIENGAEVLSNNGAGPGETSPNKNTATGAAGAILIGVDADEFGSTPVETLIVRGGGKIGSNSFGEGPGGVIVIDANGLVRLTGNGSSITSGTRGGQDAGYIEIQGGEIVIDDGAQLRTDSAGAGEGGYVLLNATGSVLISGKGTNISSNALASGNAGAIAIYGKHVLLDDAAVISSNNGTLAGAKTATGDAGGIVIGTWLDGVDTTTVESLIISGGAKISTSSFEQGEGGIISIEVDGPVMLSGPGTLLGSGTLGSKDAGRIEIGARSLVVENGATIRADSAGTGRPGDICIGSAGSECGDASPYVMESVVILGGGTISSQASDKKDDYVNEDGETVEDTDFSIIVINASDSVLVSGSGSSISSDTGGTRSGGDLTVQTASLSILDGGGLTANTSGPGQGGAIYLLLKKLQLDGMDSVIETKSLGIGAGGSVGIIADDVQVDNGARILAQALGAGDGGQVVIESASLRLLNGGQINATTLASGESGLIFIVSDVLEISGETTVIRNGKQLQQRSGILSATTGEGNALGIVLQAREISVSERGLVTVSSGGKGHAGQIIIGDHSVLAGTEIETRKVESLEISTGGEIRSDAVADGNANNIWIQADRLTIDGGGGISTRSVRSDGGNVDIEGGEFVYVGDGEISSEVKKLKGNGGNVTISGEVVVLGNGARVIASAIGGDGGDITITAEQLFRSSEAVVDASSRFGAQGGVVFDAPDADVVSGVTVLPSAYLDAAKLLHDPCAVEDAELASSLIIQGQGGVPVLPDDVPRGMEDDDAELAPQSGSGDLARAALLAMAADCAGKNDKLVLR